MSAGQDPWHAPALATSRLWNGTRWIEVPMAVPVGPQFVYPARQSRSVAIIGWLRLGIIAAAVIGLVIGGSIVVRKVMRPEPTFSKFTGPGAPLALGPPPAVPSTMDNAATRAATANAMRVVTTGCVSDGWKMGSGWPINETHVVTNAHVAGGSDDIEVQVPGGQAFLAVVVEIDFSADVAVLSVPDAHFTPMKLAQSDPAPNTQVAAIGYPGGGAEKFLPGNVIGTGKLVDVSGNEFYAQPANIPGVTEGSSGSQVIDSSGTVVGLVFSKGSAVEFVPPSHMREDINRGQGSADQIGSGHCVNSSGWLPF